jgi:hypothetical protein
MMGAFAVMIIGIHATAKLMYVLLFIWWKGITVLDKFFRSGADV